MSGKKLCEVQSVLRNAGNIQQDLFKNYFVRCEELLDEIQELNREKEVRECSEAPDADRLQKRLKKSVAKIDTFVAQLLSLERQVEQKAYESSNGWWFDDEFHKAKEIKNNLNNELQSSIRPFQQDLEAGIQMAKGCLKRAEEREKARAQAALELFRNKIKARRYRNPLDKDDIMTMDQFCATILGDTEHSTWAANSLQKIESCHQENQWDKLLEIFNELNQNLDTRIADLEHCCEEEQNKMATVVAIEKFLYDEGCQFESNIIGEKHLADGVHIRTIKTSQPVEFIIDNKVSGGSDGTIGTNVTFNIDNLQGQENCASSVERLRRGLQKMGIDPGKATRVDDSKKEDHVKSGRGTKNVGSIASGER